MTDSSSLKVSKILNDARLKRVEFDPTNIEHRAAHLIFMKTGKWVIYFHSEWPFSSVVSTVENKLLTFFLNNHATECHADALLKVYNDKVVSVLPQSDLLEV